MKRSIAILVLTTILWPLFGGELSAERRGWLFAGRRARHNAAIRMHTRVPVYRPYRTAEELYPKYYGSFHYRHLDNIGVPSGDIGLRGNGLYWSPW